MQKIEMTTQKDIAIILFGHARTYMHTVRRLKKLLFDRMDIDVFMHTWEHIDAEIASYRFATAQPRKTNIALVKELYRPVAFRVDTQGTFDPTIDRKYNFLPGEYRLPAHLSGDVIGTVTDINTELRVLNTFGYRHMLLSMQRADELRQQHEQTRGKAYDLVIATRPDIFFSNWPAALDFNNIILQDNESYHFSHPQRITPSWRRISNSPYNFHHQDVCFFSKPNEMAKITAFANHYDATKPEYLEYPEEGTSPCTTRFFMQHIISQNIFPVPLSLEMEDYLYPLRTESITNYMRLRIYTRYGQVGYQQS